MSRDPTRIPRILSLISEYWKENPDLRLGQIIVNMLPLQYKSDAFYFEDDKLEEAICSRLEKSKKEN